GSGIGSLSEVNLYGERTLYCRDVEVFFFFKQKTAYEIRLSLVGSEMCIRDSYKAKKLANKIFESYQSKNKCTKLRMGRQSIFTLVSVTAIVVTIIYKGSKNF
ncbi:hypothetical protein, partial [Polynucleobacter necessarius]|uniref:hypothetical protein n=1 Tax=Polynucleobacter necessarius TaxID=576610 RepID=UPI001E3E9CBE